MKFLSFLTQRLSFCSTNVVKVQVSWILKGKKFRCDKRLEPGVPDSQSSSLSIKPLDHRGFAAIGWFDLSTISKTRLILNPAYQYIFSAESYNQYLLCVRITTYARAVWDMETSPNHLLNCFRVMFSRKTLLLNITYCFCESIRVKKARF